MVAAAGVAATVASTAASAIGSSSQSGAVSDAAGRANAVSQQAINDAKGYRTDDRANVQPFLGQGTGAVNQLGALLGLGGPDAANTAMQSFQASPSYQYQMDQGLRAVDAGAASRGLLHSGATIKAEQTLGTNLANADFGNYLGRLNALGTMGLQAAGLNNQGTSTLDGMMGGQASGQAQTLASAGAAQSSIYGNEANALSGGITNLAKQYSYGQQKNALADLDAGKGTFGGPGGFYSP